VKNEPACAFLRLRTGLAAAAALLLGTAAAQYTHEPFFEWTHEISHAFGLEIITSRLNAVEGLGDPVPQEYLEQVEKLLARDFGRFAGTLAKRDPQLASELRHALQAVVDAVRDGEGTTEAVATARDAHERSYAQLVETELRNDPAFVAMILADLLIQDDGVAEAYEDAAEGDLWEYPTGWGALERVKVLWSEIEELASDTRRDDFHEMIEFLEGVVYPRVHPPEAIRGDPEEAEAATQRMVGILEEVADADLFPSRDLGRLAELLAESLPPFCEAYEAGDDALAVEGAYMVRNPYRKHLRRLLDLIAPEIHEPAAAILDGLVDRGPAPDDPIAACWELHELLVEARGML
jgi:hypothetical protein